MKSVYKNFQGLKSYAGLALYLGCAGFGFRLIGTHQPLMQACFVFKNIYTQSNFYFALNKLHKVLQVYMRRFYANNKNNFVVLVNLPDLFGFAIPNQRKIFCKSLRTFIDLLGSAIICGTRYAHPNKQLLTTNSKAA